MKCDWCGEEFERKSNHQRFCSRKCQRAYARKKLKKAKTDVRKCPVCGKNFMAYEWSNQVCCNNECYTIYHRDNMREYARKHRTAKKKQVFCRRVRDCFYGSGGVCEYLYIEGRPRGTEVENCSKFKQRYKEDGMSDMRNYP